MKIFLATITCLISSVTAFAPAFVPRAETVFQMSRPDSSDAIAEAMRLSTEFGPSSVEARLAWEAVEEMDSSDTSSAYSGGLTEEECLVNSSERCRDYDNKVQELAILLEEQKANIGKVKSLATEIQAIKLVPPTSKPSPDSPAMKKSVIKAIAANGEFGPESAQAKLAWETVEELAASDNSEAIQSSLDDECLIESIEACEALEEFTRALNLESSVSRYSG